jgi:hypothetical protein
MIILEKKLFLALQSFRYGISNAKATYIDTIEKMKIPRMPRQYRCRKNQGPLGKLCGAINLQIL